MHHSTWERLRLRQHGWHFADNLFKCILLNENIRISIKISLKFVPKGLYLTILQHWFRKWLSTNRRWAIIWISDGLDYWCIYASLSLNGLTWERLRLRQHSWHFADNTFKCIFLYDNHYILITISLKFVPEGPIDNKSWLVQVMAWCQTGTKPLPEPMMTQTCIDWLVGMYVGHDTSPRVEPLHNALLNMERSLVLYQ